MPGSFTKPCELSVEHSVELSLRLAPDPLLSAGVLGQLSRWEDTAEFSAGSRIIM
ncbi:hypothetical protein IMCC26207_109647 [Actinobacteria bacterium IMCC26207]|nr:hypothetical protein IMCC26207_109647 [Actinobacteria bacterium IMCC26207]